MILLIIIIKGSNLYLDDKKVLGILNIEFFWLIIF